MRSTHVLRSSMRSTRILPLLLLALTQNCLSLKIKQPEYLKGEYKHDTALFGKVPYGTSMVGRLVYIKQSPTVCEPLSSDRLPKTLSKVIVLVERGACSFAQKARDVAQSGADAVVIFDDHPENIAHLYMADDNMGDVGIPAVFIDYYTGLKFKYAAEMSDCQKHAEVPDTNCDPATNCACDSPKLQPPNDPDKDLAMALCDKVPGCVWNTTYDTVNGTRVPSQPYCAACPHPSQTSAVQVVLSWYLPSPDNHVEWELWTSSSDRTSSIFKAEFAPVAKVLLDSGKASFEPHFVIIDGDEYECQKSCKGNPNCPSTGFVCGLQCTNNGRYCAVDPDDDISSGKDGSDIVQENLRQMCIYRTLQGGHPRETYRWWQYAVLFDEHCSEADRTFNANCSHTQMLAAGINVAEVQACVEASGGADPNSNATNPLLEAAIGNMTSNDILLTPTMRVNNEQLAGDYDLGCAPQLGGGISITNCGPLRAICAGFQKDTSPDWCQKDYCWPPSTVDVCGICGGDGSSCQDCRHVEGETGWKFDSCGQCRDPSSPGFVVGECTSADRDGGGSNTALIVGLIAGGSVALLGSGFVVMRRYVRQREDEMKREFRDMLSEYAPIDRVNSMVGRPKPKPKSRIGKGLQRLAGKRRSAEHNPIVQHAEDAADGAGGDGEMGEWAGDDGRVEVEMRVAEAPAYSPDRHESASV